jgi:2-polyprenyl-3-methyl-5-hydroxy-6-metoxy-1,4-benzoquinol methylase
MDQNKENIKKDFAFKQNTYFKNNYSEESNNFIRKLRKDLIFSIFKNETKYNKILDVGSGPSLLYPELLNNTKEYIVLDLVQSNLDKIKQEYYNFKNIKFVCSDIDSYKSNEKHDLIICSGSLEYTDKPIENILKLISFLEKNGLLIASFPNFYSPYRIWSEYFYKYIFYLNNKIRKKKRFYYKRRLFKEKDIKKALKSCFYSKSYFIYFGLNIIFQPLDDLFNKLNKIILKFGHKNKLYKNLYSEFLLIINM